MTPSVLATFAADVTPLVADPHAIGERLGALLAEDDWLPDEYRVPNLHSYRQHLLYVSPDRDLSIVALVWLPGQRTPIHDHVSWCVVGVYRGVERETHYRLEDGGRLVPTGTFEAPAGHVEALVPPAENIHSVTAVGDEKTISIHVYGADIERLGTSILRRYDDVARLAVA